MSETQWQVGDRVTTWNGGTVMDVESVELLTCGDAEGSSDGRYVELVTCTWLPIVFSAHAPKDEQRMRRVFAAQSLCRRGEARP